VTRRSQRKYAIRGDVLREVPGKKGAEQGAGDEKFEKWRDGVLRSAGGFRLTLGGNGVGKEGREGEKGEFDRSCRFWGCPTEKRGGTGGSGWEWKLNV